MVVVRNTFQVKFGRMKEAVVLMKANVALTVAAGSKPARLMTDVTGPFYTLVLEHEFDSLADMEKSASSMMKLPGWQEAYQKFAALADSGRRDIYTIVG
jgi:hypothetical protein